MIGKRHHDKLQRWGVTYTGCGDLHAAARAVRMALERIHMDCDTQTLAGGILLIEAEQTKPWYQIVRHTLPQRVTWRLAKTDRELSITADFRLFRWYALLLLVLWFLAGSGLLAGALLTTFTDWLDDHSGLDWFFTMCPFPAGFLGVFNWSLFDPLGGGKQVTAVWQAVLARLERGGEVFEPQGPGVTRRFATAALAYIGSFAALACWLVVTDPQGRQTVTETGLYLLFLGVGILLLCLLVALIGELVQRGFLLRFTPLSVGFSSLLTLAIWLALPLPWLIMVKLGFDLDRLRPFLERQGTYLVPPLHPKSWDPARIAHIQGLYEEHLAMVYDMCWMTIGFSLFLLVLAVAMTLYIIDVTLYTRLQLHRLQSHSDVDLYRQAISGGSRLRWIRGIFVTVWFCLSGFILLASGYAQVCALQAVRPISLEAAYQAPELSANVVTFLLGRAYGDPVVGFAVRSIWLLYGLATMAALAGSLGHLLKSRWKERRRLRGMAKAFFGDQELALQDVLKALSENTSHPPATLVVSKDHCLQVSTQSFGVWRRERFIEISAGLFEYMNTAELKALLAHELAHLEKGHLQTLNLLRWLGRLTLTGDGFVVALLNSFGYEQEADRQALDASWTTTTALESCLTKKWSAPSSSGRDRSVLISKEMKIGDGHLPLDPGQRERTDEEVVLDGDLLQLPRHRRWRLAWSLFWQQYSRPMTLHSWHPAYADRIRAVRIWRREHEISTVSHPEPGP